MENLHERDPEFKPITLLNLVRDEPFRNEHTAAALVRKLWRVPHPEEWQHLTSQPSAWASARSGCCRRRR